MSSHLCGNCRWYGTEIIGQAFPGLLDNADDYKFRRCLHEHSILWGARPTGWCNLWAEKEPLEYRPGNGPFYALRIGEHWAVSLGYAADGDSLFDGSNNSALEARQLVGALNRACREWHYNHDNGCVGCLYFGGCVYPAAPTCNRDGKCPHITLPKSRPSSSNWHNARQCYPITNQPVLVLDAYNCPRLLQWHEEKQAWWSEGIWWYKEEITWWTYLPDKPPEVE